MMPNRILIYSEIIVLLTAGAPSVFGDDKELDKFFSATEQSALVVALAKKVDLFREVWSKNPDAEITAGTAKIFIYWIVRQFDGAKNRAEAEVIYDQLLALEVIEVQDFLQGASDADIVSPPLGINYSKYRLTKIDYIDPDRYDTRTTIGHTYAHQGHIPVEVIRLGQTGILPWSGMGRGATEIMGGGTPTITFASDEVFATTKYAKEMSNHPILLLLRYLRTLVDHYDSRNPDGVPKSLADFEIDEAIEKKLRRVIKPLIEGHDLVAYLKRENFRRWLNHTIQGAFRTNADAALLLMEAFQINELVRVYPHIEPYNDYLFTFDLDPKEVAAHHAEYEVGEGFYTPAKRAFPGLVAFHGTRTEENYEAILLEGFRPSEKSTRTSAGPGLYSVPKDHVDFAIDWGGSIDRVAIFPVAEDAKIVDITHGEGKRVYDLFVGRTGGDETAFALYFDVHSIGYPYLWARAYVWKNRKPLGYARGYKRKVYNLRALQAQAAAVDTEGKFFELIAAVRQSRLQRNRRRLVFSYVPDTVALKEEYMQALRRRVSDERFFTEYLEKHAEGLAGDNFQGFEQFRYAASVIGLGPVYEFKLIRMMFDREYVERAEQFVELLSAPEFAQTPARRVQRRRFVRDHLDFYLNLPGARRFVRALLAQCMGDLELQIHVSQRAMEAFPPKRAADLLSLVHVATPQVSLEDRMMLDGYLNRVAELLGPLNPAPSHWIALHRELHLPAEVRADLVIKLLADGGITEIAQALRLAFPAGVKTTSAYVEHVSTALRFFVSENLTSETPLEVLKEFLERTQLTTQEKFDALELAFVRGVFGEAVDLVSLNQLKVTPLKASTKRAVERFTRSKIKWFFNRNPSVETCHQLVSYAPTEALEFQLRDEVLNRGIFDRAGAFAAFAKPTQASPSEEYQKKLDAFIARALPIIARLGPADDESSFLRFVDGDARDEQRKAMKSFISQQEREDGATTVAAYLERREPDKRRHWEAKTIQAWNASFFVNPRWALERLKSWQPTAAQVREFVQATKPTAPFMAGLAEYFLVRFPSPKELKIFLGFSKRFSEAQRLIVERLIANGEIKTLEQAVTLLRALSPDLAVQTVRAHPELAKLPRRSAAADANFISLLGADQDLLVEQLALFHHLPSHLLSIAGKNKSRPEALSRLAEALYPGFTVEASAEDRAAFFGIFSQALGHERRFVEKWGRPILVQALAANPPLVFAELQALHNELTPMMSQVLLSVFFSQARGWDDAELRQRLSGGEFLALFVANFSHRPGSPLFRARRTAILENAATLKRMGLQGADFKDFRFWWGQFRYATRRTKGACQINLE